MQYTGPLIINTETTRDCIVVDSNKYCRDVDVSGKELALGLSLMALVAFLILGYAWLYVEDIIPGKYALILPGILVLIGLVWGLS